MAEGVSESSSSGIQTANYDLSEKNIIFGDTRPVLRARARVAKPELTRVTEFAAAEQPWTIDTLSTRWQEIKEFTWPSTGTNRVLTTVNILGDLTSSSGYFATMAGMFSFCRPDIHIKVMVNTTKFHTGRLMVLWSPFGFLNATDAQFLGRSSCAPHVFIDAAMGNDAEIIIPYAHYQSLVSTLNNSSANNYFGTLYIIAVNWLGIAPGVSSSVGGSIWFSVENMKWAVPGSRHTPFLSAVAQSGDSPEETIHQETARVVNKTSGLTWKNVLSSIKDVAHIGWTLAKTGFLFLDNPVDPSLGDVNGTRELSPQCYSTGTFKGIRMTANPMSTLRLGEAQDLNLDEMDLRYLMGIPAIALSTSLSSIEARPMVIPVHPRLASATNITGVTGLQMDHTWLSYYSNCFAFWKGSIKYKFDFVCPYFISGRIAVSYIPEYSTEVSVIAGTADKDRILAYPTIIMDLNEGRIFEFEIPYAAISVYKRVPPSTWDSTGTKADYSTGECNGVLVVQVLNTIVVGSGVSSNRWLWIWTSAGSDFEVLVPRSILGTQTGVPVAIPVIAADAQAGEKPEEATTRDETILGDTIPLMDIKKDYNPTYMGESFMHLKFVLGRRTLLFNTNTPTATTFVIQVTPVKAAGTAARETLLSYMSTPFLFWKGSIRYSMIHYFDNSSEAWCDVEYTARPNGRVVPMLTQEKYRQFDGWFAAITKQLTGSKTVDVEVPFQSEFDRLLTRQQIGMLSHAHGQLRISISVARPDQTLGCIRVYTSAGSDYRVEYPISPGFSPDQIVGPRESSSNTPLYQIPLIAAIAQSGTRVNVTGKIIPYSEYHTLSYVNGVDFNGFDLRSDIYKWLWPTFVGGMCDSGYTKKLLHNNIEDYAYYEVDMRSKEFIDKTLSRKEITEWDRIVLSRIHPDHKLLVDTNGHIIVVHRTETEVTVFESGILWDSDSYNITVTNLVPKSFLDVKNNTLSAEAQSDEISIEELQRKIDQLKMRTQYDVIDDLNAMSVLANNVKQAIGSLELKLEQNRTMLIKMEQSIQRVRSHLSTEAQNGVRYLNAEAQAGDSVISLISNTRLIFGISLVVTTVTTSFALYKLATSASGVFNRSEQLVASIDDTIFGGLSTALSSTIVTRHPYFGGATQYTLKMILMLIDLFRMSTLGDFMMWMSRLMIDFPGILPIDKIGEFASMVFRVSSSWFSTLTLGCFERAVAHSFGAPEIFTIGVMVLLFMVTRTLPRENDVKGIVARVMSRFRTVGIACTSLVAVSRAVPVLSSCAEYLLASIWGVMDEQQKFLNEFHASMPDMTEWARTVVNNYNDNYRARLRYSQEAQDQVRDLWIKAQRYHHIIMSSDQRCGSTINAFMSVFKMCQTMNDEALNGRDNRGIREEPFCIMVYGPPGIGKTRMSRSMMQKLMAADGVDTAMGNIYTRSISDAYWSNYAGQYTTFYDDFGAILAEYDNNETAYREFINIKTRAPFALNMASVNEKGRFFTSKLIWMTSNCPFYVPNAIACPEAFLRRRDILVEMIADEKLLKEAKAGKKVDPYLFTVKDSMGGSKDLKVLISYEELQSYLIERFVAWRAKEVFEVSQELTPVAQIGEITQTVTEEITDSGGIESSASDETVALYRNLETRAYNVGMDVRDYIANHTGILELKRLITRLKETSIWHQASNIFGGHPWRSALLAFGFMIPLATVGAYLVSSPDSDAQSDDHRLKLKSKTSRSRLRYISARNQASSSEYLGPKHDLKTEQLINNVLRKNIVRLSYVYENSIKDINCLIVRGRTALIPVHFFAWIKNGQKLSVQCTDRSLPVEVYYDEKCLRKVAGVDLAVYTFPKTLYCHKDITNHFMREDMLKYYGRAEAFLVIPKLKSVNIVSVNAHVVGLEGAPGASYTVEGEDFKLAEGWKYNAPVTKGDCGAPLVLNDTRSDGKICGLHVCGNERIQSGWSIMLTYEDIVELLADVEVITPPVNTIEIVDAQNGDSPYPMVFPEGDFTYLGVIRKPMYMNDKTCIRKSPLFGKMYPPLTFPSVLKVKDPRCEVPGSPLQRSVEKYGGAKIILPPADVDMVIEHLTSVVRSLPVRYEGKIVDDEVAIYGIPGDVYLKPTDWGTSAGYIYRKHGLNDKKALAEDPNSLFWKLYKQREDDCKNAIMSETVWLDCLKDERRPLEKIKLGKTRSFCIGPMDHTILGRKYFCMFMANAMAAHGEFFSMIGVNPESFEWNNFYLDLASFSPVGVDLDYSQFDGGTDAELMMRFVDIVNGWYQLFPTWELVHDVVRKIIFECMIHRLVVCLNLIYIVHGGNPSGNFITSMLNGFVNGIYVRCIWMQMRRLQNLNPSLYFFDLFVKDFNYGDDLVLSVKQGFDVKLFIEVARQNNIILTSADKGSEITGKKISDLSFLKRRFVLIDEVPGVHFSALNRTSVNELMNWITKNGHPLELFEQNIEQYCLFLCHYGREEYDKETRKLINLLREEHLSMRVPCFREVFESIYY